MVLRCASWCSEPSFYQAYSILFEDPASQRVLFFTYRFRALACCLPAGLLGARAKLPLQQGWVVAGSKADISRCALRRSLPK